MKIRRIPAQITTVEDKIAGNLNLTQMILLIIPVFVFMLVYTTLPPSMHFAWYKVLLFFATGSVPLFLAIRVKEKLILNWLIILLGYALRPKYYLFNKNDLSLRTTENTATKRNKNIPIQTSTTAKEQRAQAVVSFGDLVRLEGLLANPKYSFSIKSQKKGVFHVAFEQKQHEGLLAKTNTNQRG